MSLATLALRDNKIGDCGAWGLGKALAVSSSLTFLRRELQMAKRERDAALRDKDAAIARLRGLAYGLEAMDVETGATHILEDAGAGAAPLLKRMRRSKRPASA